MILVPMPSSIGHAIAGAAAAWGADLVPGDRAWRTAPQTASWYRRAGDGLTLACAALAASPDLDLIFGSHRRYTHSVGAVILVGLVAAIVARRVHRPVARVALMCAGAYATHLVLDWMAVDLMPPYGLRAFWPFSNRWVISGWNVFRQTERWHFLSVATIWVNFKAVVQEVVILGPCAIVVWLIRVKTLARLAAELPCRHHSAQ
jgi:membrane-bound metal-dependent hydrolase YbcI (DUF457 family)